LKETGWKKGLLAADRCGVETDRYEEVVCQNKRWFEKVRRFLYLK